MIREAVNEVHKRIHEQRRESRERRIISARLNTTLREGNAPTPVLLPGESHGWRSLVGFSP